MSFNLTIPDYPYYTHKYYGKWESDWKLIHSIPYARSPAPNRHHQHFESGFVTVISNALSRNGSNCECDVLHKPHWHISEDAVVRPDVIVVCEKLKDDFVTILPSLILEIRSSSTILKNHNTRFNLYQAYGVRYYLTADSGNKMGKPFRLETKSLKK